MELVARIRVQYRTKLLQDELRESNRRLRELEALRESLTGFIVHDLKNAVMPAGLGLRLCLQQVSEPSPQIEKIKDLLGLCIKNVRLLEGMIADLLDAGRLEERKLPLRLEPCDPGAILDECRSRMELLARSRKARLTVHPPAGSGSVLADKELVLRVLTNLAGNAVKFSDHKDRRVDLSARRDPSRSAWTFSVQDNGMGIPRDQLDRVFDKFFRVQTPGHTVLPGTGIGLAFCRLVVEAHGGRIWAESEPGKGSRFSFDLKAP